MAVRSARPAPASRRARPHRPRRALSAARHRDVVVVAAALLVLGLYVWSVGTSTKQIPHRPNDQYNVLGDAFAHGRLDLRPRPPAGLLALRDPYEPRANAPFRTADFTDLSLYDGRLYAYWGPVPAVVLFGPWHALDLGGFPIEIAVLLFAAVALLAGVALLRELVGRFAPDAPPWALAGAVVTFGAANGSAFVLRVPETHQCAVAAGAAFAFAGLLALVRATRSPRPDPRLLAAGSLALGLAAGSRASLLVLALAPLALAWRLGRRGAPAERRRAVAALLGPLGAVLALLLAYDAVRFGSPLETGLSFQLGAIDWHRVGTVHLASAPGLAREYLVHVPRVSAQFPYLFLDPLPPATPRLYYAEPLAGLLLTTPVVALAALALSRRLVPRAAARLVGAAVGLAALVLAGLAAFPSVAMRFTMDFAGLLVLGALTAWLAALSGRARGRRSRRRRRAVAVAGGVLAAYSAVAGLALNVGDQRIVALLHPGTLDRLQRAFAPLPTAASAVAGRPLLASVDGLPRFAASAPNAAPPAVLRDGGRLTVRVASGTARRALLRVRLAALPGPPGAPRTVVARSAGGLLSRAPAAPGTVTLDVALRRGLDRVALTLAGPPGAPGPRFAVGDVRLDG